MTSGPATLAVAFITLGCPKNEVDTDKMRSAIASSAFALAEDVESADVVVINTCSFIQVATEESIETVLDAASNWLPQREGRRIIVAGCMPSRYGDGLTAEMPEVAAFLPVAEETALLDTLECITGVSARKSSNSARRTQAGPSAYLQISDGCHRKCAYCTIPSIRGPYQSREIADIVAEAGELVALGARELVLIGQDITAWGRDLSGAETLANVVRAVAAVPGVDWLRLMYAQPDGVTDELLSAMADNPNVCRYLDMPLQHASMGVLRAMRRSGDAETFLALIDRARSVMPDIALRTTVIAGFPGETTRDVNELLRFIEAARFDYVGVFPYSAEDGTPAAEMPDQVPTRTRRARAQRVRDVADAVGFEKVSQHVGEVLEVLVEGFDPDEEALVGRWRGQAPEIDGIVLLDKGEPGQILSARIVDSLGYDLEGEIVS
jgi:ribosomal protein S12 methylthiotransferase